MVRGGRFHTQPGVRSGADVHADVVHVHAAQRSINAVLASARPGAGICAARRATPAWTTAPRTRPPARVDTADGARVKFSSGVASCAVPGAAAPAPSPVGGADERRRGSPRRRRRRPAANSTWCISTTTRIRRRRPLFRCRSSRTRTRPAARNPARDYSWMLGALTPPWCEQFPTLAAAAAVDAAGGARRPRLLQRRPAPGASRVALDRLRERPAETLLEPRDVAPKTSRPNAG